ncbi:glycosyl transferase family 2 [Bisgaard Taxon 10/6]|uniref:LpxL/LpxP family acyltransferase n=1 Tax=Exercitatus varius TaxID=67857 RepID=UPI00294ABC8E|nr:glycosyl transferase family 2 [Exercitatus varius]MDG2961314.1 glycosyl transferase family 2 [Exercitatus varius]
MMRSHWAEQRERGNLRVLKLTAWLVRYCPMWLMKGVTFCVVGYFYLTSFSARRNIARYQQRLRNTFPAVPSMTVFAQFMAFGEALVDRFAVWQNKLIYRDVVIENYDGLFNELRQPRKCGQILLCSHFGNVEICRAFANKHPYFKLNVLVHSRHAEAFNQALQQAGAEKLNLIQVTDLNVDLMLELQQRLSCGEWIAIAADRIPVYGSKTEKVNFLGALAEFPQGAWLLAALLNAPLNTLFCVKRHGRYYVKLQRFLPEIAGKRTVRQQAISQAVQKYADLLAQECANSPLLWFNFYDFWQDDKFSAKK